jgi:formylglycine-generating enzyme required for sulfatase activity
MRPGTTVLGGLLLVVPCLTATFSCENQFALPPDGLHALTGSTVSPDDIDIEWVPIPGRVLTVEVPYFSYEQGSTYGTVDVDVAPFEIMKARVTMAQYDYVMWDTPGWGQHSSDKDEVEVESVTWYEAVAFCKGIGARLCSLSENQLARNDECCGVGEHDYGEWLADCYHAEPLDLMPLDGSAWTDNCFRPPMKIAGLGIADGAGTRYDIGVRCCR